MNKNNKKEYKLTEKCLDKALKILATQLNEKGKPFVWYRDCYSSKPKV